MPRPPLSLDPATTAALFIEAQNGIVGPQSVIPDLRAAAVPALPFMGRLAAGFRAAGAKVFHLTYQPTLELRSSNRKPPLLQYTLPAMKDWTLGHPATQPIDEIGLEPGDILLPRFSGMSPTANTEIFPMLRNAGFTTVVLAGVSVNVAMPVVATNAADEGFDVIVPRDAVAGTPVEYAESVLRHTMPVLARVSTTEEVLAALVG